MAHFIGKDQDKNLVAWLIKKYNLTRGEKAYNVAKIEDKPQGFIVQLLAGWMLWKWRPKKVLGPAIKLVDTARDGIQYNWDLHLLNEFNDNCIAV